jgi:hypothetical protein
MSTEEVAIEGVLIWQHVWMDALNEKLLFIIDGLGNRYIVEDNTVSRELEDLLMKKVRAYGTAYEREGGQFVTVERYDVLE